MYLSHASLLTSIVLNGALSAAVSVPNRQYSHKRAIVERANPHIGNKAIVKRANPTIGDGIDVNDPQRGGKLIPRENLPTSGAFSNAFQLMNYVITSTGSANDAIFAKYFNDEDKEVVLNVFRRLYGFEDDDDTGDEDNEGAAALANIKIIAGEDDPDDPAPAFLEDFADEFPNLILRDDAWVYPDRDDEPDACLKWEDEGMSQDMYLLGSVLLHEYTHWDWFLESVHQGEIIDQPNGYGWEGARELDKTLAKYNADSYGWYATEFFWAVICGKATGYD